MSELPLQLHILLHLIWRPIRRFGRHFILVAGVRARHGAKEVVVVKCPSCQFVKLTVRVLAYTKCPANEYLRKEESKRLTCSRYARKLHVQLSCERTFFVRMFSNGAQVTKVFLKQRCGRFSDKWLDSISFWWVTGLIKYVIKIYILSKKKSCSRNAIGLHLYVFVKHSSVKKMSPTHIFPFLLTFSTNYLFQIAKTWN